MERYSELKQAGAKFLKECKDNVGILFDNDGDGVTSAAILLAYFKQKKIKAKIVCGDIGKNHFDAFGKMKFDHYITCDLGVGQNPEYLEELVGKHVMILDHHTVNVNLNASGFLFVNPRIEKPKAYISTAHIAYDICKLAGLKGFKWISRIGMASDREIKGIKDELEGADMIAAVGNYKGFNGLESVVSSLARAKNIDEFIYNEKWRTILNKFRDEVEKQVALVELQGLRDITFFEVDGRSRVFSEVSTVLLDRYPKKTFVIYKKRHGLYKISGRSYKYNLAKIFRDSTKGIGNGGGHPVAAGAHVPPEHFRTFMNRVKKLLK